jgi:hypothetical protein
MYKYFCGKVLYMDKKAKKESNNGKEIAKNASFHLQKLKTIMKTYFTSKNLLFKETLEFKNGINLCDLR